MTHDLTELREALVDVIDRADHTLVSGLLEQALALHPVADVPARVVTPLLEDVGRE